MKIVVNGVSAKSGGAATYIQNLVESVSRLGEDYEFVFCVPEGFAPRQPNGIGARFVESSVGRQSAWRRLWWDQVTLRALVRKEKADVLVSSSDFGLLLPPCKQVLLLRNALFFSRLYMRQFLPRKSLRNRVDFWMRHWLVRLSVRRADVIVTATASMLSEAREFVSVPPGKAVINPFGVPLSRFRPTVKASREGFRLLHVSEYADYKNLGTLLEAMRILARRDDGDAHLTTTADPTQFPDVEIPGRDTDALLAREAVQTGNVTFVGGVPYSEISVLYTQSDAFIFPSLVESFGHPLVEAMASGLPVIASDIPVHREVCGEAALYFNPLDPEALADVVTQIRGNSALRMRMAITGRERAAALFDWTEHVRRLAEMLRNVCV